MATTPTQIRLTEGDKAKLDAIRERMGLPSLAAAVRYSLIRTHLLVFPESRDAPKKSRKKGVDSVATDDILKV